MNHKGRIEKLETGAGLGQRYGYMCVIGGLVEAWDTPEERAKGYKIQPFIQSQGGTGGEPFYLATREELDAFAARPDVDFHLIEIAYTSDPQQVTR